jgi:hypothetical protein
MKTILAAAIAVALVAAAASALAGSRAVGSPYTVEIRDVAGAKTLTVWPEVTVTVPGHLQMPEVVVSANLMPEVVVRAYPVPEVARVPATGFWAVD